MFLLNRAHGYPKKSFMISTISAGGDALARAVHERISTNMTVISSSTPLNPALATQVIACPNSCNGTLHNSIGAEVAVLFGCDTTPAPIR